MPSGGPRACPELRATSSVPWYLPWARDADFCAATAGIAGEYTSSPAVQSAISAMSSGTVNPVSSTR